VTDRREQLSGALLFTLLVTAGWAPYVVTTMRMGMYNAPSVLFGGICGIATAGFIYDAAERLLGIGRGVYAMAIAATFIPAAIVISEPPLLSYASLLFVTSACVWFASRAKPESARESLLFIALLSGISFAVFGGWPPAAMPLASLFLMRATAQIGARSILLVVVAAIVGALTGRLLNLPSPLFHQPDIAVNALEATLLIAPWTAFAIWTAFSGGLWYRLTLCGFLLLLIAHIETGGEWLALTALVMPFMALAIAEAVGKWFEHESENRWQHARWLSFALFAALLLPVFARIGRWELLFIDKDLTIICAAVGGALIGISVRDYRRWIFGLHAAASLLIGVLWWHYWPQEELTGGEVASSGNILQLVPWFFIALAVVRIVTRLYLGRRMPRALRQSVPNHSFEQVVFRRFDNVGRREWIGTAVEVPLNQDKISFAIFGDTAGSEYPFSSRQSGYSAYQTLAQILNVRAPDFVVSTGDLAARAAPNAYRRLRQMLRHIKRPLIATPGNHDLVDRRTVHAQYFRALFGSDHGDIEVGPARLILLNNAWGSLTDDQLAWIERTLAKPSAAPFTFVFCHKPIFDPREDTYYGMEHRPHAERLHELFQRANVNAVFSGHIHSLLTVERDGVQYVISGGGGSKLKTESDKHHYLWCEVTQDTARITAHAVGDSSMMLDLKLEPKR